MSQDEDLRLTSEALQRAWGGFGEVDGDVLAHLVNPTFMGGPRWPALRQAWRVARRPGAVLCASDGLSDPFDDGEGAGDVNGFELEVYAVTDEPPADLAGSWFFGLVWQVSQLCAGDGRVAELLGDIGPISTELHDVPIPAPHRERFVNEHGRVGAIVGVRHPDVIECVAGPRSSIALVGVALLTLDELAFVVEGKAQARAALARRFSERGGVSNLTRPSLLH